MIKTGKVYIIGAGPGDAGLITLRGIEVLRRADVVIYDMLVNPDLLRLAPAAAELISRGSQGAANALSQEALNELMITVRRGVFAWIWPYAFVAADLSFLSVAASRLW